MNIIMDHYKGKSDFKGEIIKTICRDGHYLIKKKGIDFYRNKLQRPELIY